MFFLNSIIRHRTNLFDNSGSSLRVFHCSLLCLGHSPFSVANKFILVLNCKKKSIQLCYTAYTSNWRKESICSPNHVSYLYCHLACCQCSLWPTVCGTWGWLLALFSFGLSMSSGHRSFYHGNDWHLLVQVLRDFVIMDVLLGVLEPVFCFCLLLAYLNFHLKQVILGITIGINN